METLRCLIIDDERLARVELTALLTEIAGCTVVGDTGHPEQAAALIGKLRPDLLFLDINMPGCNGFELLSQLAHCPPVVFVTAYDEFALRAFGVHALDYLLKPVTPARLADCIRAIRNRQTAAAAPGRQLFIPSDYGGHYLPLAEVFLIRAYGHYLRFYHQSGSDLLYQTLEQMVAGLPGEEFFRANRSAIFRVSAVTGRQRLSRGRYLFQLPGGQQVTVSERQAVLWRQRGPDE
ncbi:MAG: LytTR family DNA-binding domain-containing protein [Saprospiraceae bacterium]